MTKAALKEKYTAWNIEISRLDDKKSEIWKKLQDMCEEYGDGKRWCCLQKLIEELVKAGKVYQTMDLVSEYYKIEGQQEALKNLAIATHNFDIGGKKTA